MHGTHDPETAGEVAPHSCGQPAGEPQPGHDVPPVARGGEAVVALVSLHAVPPPPRRAAPAQALERPQAGGAAPSASTPAPGVGWSLTAFDPQRVLKPERIAPKRVWRRLLYRASRGTLDPGPSPAERAERALTAWVTAALGDVRCVAVLSRKAGGPVHLGALRPATKLAYLHLAAAVADGLAAPAQELPARPTRRSP